MVHGSAPLEGHDGASKAGLSKLSWPLDCCIDGEMIILDGSLSGCFL